MKIRKDNLERPLLGELIDGQIDAFREYSSRKVARNPGKTPSQEGNNEEVHRECDRITGNIEEFSEGVEQTRRLKINRKPSEEVLRISEQVYARMLAAQYGLGWNRKNAG